MMKKIMLVVALMVVWSGVFGKEVEAVAGCQEKISVWNSDMTALVDKYIDLEKDQSACSYEGDYTGDKLGSTVKTCVQDNDGTYHLSGKYCASYETYYCVESGGKATCVSPGDLPKCTSTYDLQNNNGKTVSWNEISCIDEKTVGKCYHDGVIRPFKTCGDELSYCHMWQGLFSHWTGDCQETKCEKDGIKYALNQQQCNETSYHVYSTVVCGIEGWTTIKECKGDCAYDEAGGKAYCKEDGVLNCELVNGINSGRSLPKGESICYGGNPYVCNSPPEFEPNGTCTAEQRCAEYTDGNAAKCVPKGQGVGDNEVPDTITSMTSIYDPLCVSDTGSSGVNTAFGCIPYDAQGFAAKFLQILFGIGGGIAFLLMVYGFILVATSSGDEKKLQAAKETITSAITGLLICIFALFLFRLIVINILKIPLD